MLVEVCGWRVEEEKKIREDSRDEENNKISPELLFPNWESRVTALHK